MTVLEVNNLQVKRGQSLVVDVAHLTVQSQEVLAIIGPNGAGKTTLLLTLAMLHPPTSGEIIFEGQKISPRINLSKRNLLNLRRRMAVVFQEPLLFDTTVFENVASGLKVRRITRNELKDRVFGWLDQLGIAHLAKRSARTLSGGEAQRVNLARAFVLHPQILFMDEPLAALDPLTKEKLIQDLEIIFQKTKITALFVTHDRNEAMRLGHRVGVMIRGKIMQLDPPAKVFSFPANGEVARFVGVENILQGQVVSQQNGLAQVDIMGTNIHIAGDNVHVGENLLVCLRPEDITLTNLEAMKNPSSARNRLLGVVVNIIPLGSLYKIILQCGFPLVALVTKQSLSELSLKKGQEVLACFKATAAHIIRK